MAFFAISAFIKGLFACSVGPLKLSLRISSYWLSSSIMKVYYWSKFQVWGTNQSWDLEGGAYAPPLSLPLKSQRSPYEGLKFNHQFGDHCTTIWTLQLSNSTIKQWINITHVYFKANYQPILPHIITSFASSPCGIRLFHTTISNKNLPGAVY